MTEEKQPLEKVVSKTITEIITRQYYPLVKKWKTIKFAEITPELEEQFSKHNEAYKRVLEHRSRCHKWRKEFCLECFGGGLVNFTKEVFKELRKNG